MDTGSLDPETWLDLEKLARRIYAELAPECEVSHDARLMGSLSETLRQIDVLIEDRARDVRVIVDCKDRARRVSLPEAHAFAGLVEDVEATGGVLICNRGFSKATRTLARAKGFQLAGLHDVASRKWRLDVQIPIVWTRLWLEDLRLGVKARFNAGDTIDTAEAPRFFKDGTAVDIRKYFEEAWNAGDLHSGEAGEGELTTRLDWEASKGHVVNDTQIMISYRVGAASRLGYVTPQEARGIFDEETRSFTTVHFDVGRTVDQEPEGGWRDIFDPDQLVIRTAGTIVTMAETAGVSVEFTDVSSVLGAEPHNRHFAWRRAGGGQYERSGPQAAAARASTTVLVRVRGQGSDAVLRPLDSFMNLVGTRGVIRMSDPAAFSNQDYIDETIELEVHGASSEEEARAIVQAMIEQTPGGSRVLTPETFV